MSDLLSAGKAAYSEPKPPTTIRRVYGIDDHGSAVEVVTNGEVAGLKLVTPEEYTVKLEKAQATYQAALMAGK